MERYERLKILGVGSFGKVYLMRHRQQRRLVCAKIIKIKNIPRKEREACRTEVELMRRLHHPNIVGYKDSFLTPRKDHLCIVMEYCDGGDLSTQIKNARRRLFPESKILHWFVQIALGLHYMHARLVLHRDLKTQNIFLLGNGRLVLGDLGISKVLEGTMDFASTRIGTPYYMSPELFNNKPYNHKSDIWALGCVLYEMAALTHAFDATSLHGLASRVAKGRYPSIHVKYSRNLRDLISRMLSTSPAQRPDLDQILQQDFIKTHIHNFLADIVSRESHKIGEGTMVLKAAAVNMLADAEGSSSPSGFSGDGGIAGLGSNQDMLSLKRQMEALGLQDEVKRALNPPERIKPTDARSAAKVVKEQTGALRREEDRRKAVESALARLRNEREERLRLRHAKERGSQPVPPPPPPPAAPEPGAKVSRGNVGWQAGIVGVGVGVASGESSEEVRSGRGGGAGAEAVAARQVEVSAARRMGGLLGPGAREARQGVAAPPDVSEQSPGVPVPRSRESRRSLEPRERREESGSSSSRAAPSSRAQNRRRSFGGEARKASPAIGGSAAARGRGGGGGRARSNASDKSDEPPRNKDVVKHGRAKEAGRLAADAMIRREEASSREAARKRGEGFQRESNRLRLDKVELDRKMKEREQQRRQRVTEAAIKAVAVDTKEEREKKLQQNLLPIHRQEAAVAAPAPPTPLPVDSTSSQGAGSAAGTAAVALAAAAAAAAEAAVVVVPVPPSLGPRLRARWAHANISGNNLSPEAAPPTALEAIQQQKREKARLEAEVNRKEVELLQAENVGRGRAPHLLPPPPLPPPPPPVVPEGSTRTPSATKDPSAGQQSDAHGPPLVAEPVEDSLSPCSSGSEDSDDSDSLLWKPGAGRRGNRGRGGPVAAAVAAGKGRQGGNDDRASRVGSDGVMRAGEGSGDEEDDGGDEADEDIHAREELLEVELQAATTRCRELRHNLQETKSLIPTTEEASLVAGGGEGDGSRHDDLVGRRSKSTTTAAPPATAADTPHRRPPPRPGLAHADDPGEDEEEREEEGEAAAGAGARGTNEKVPPLLIRPGGEPAARLDRGGDYLQGDIRGGVSNNDIRRGRHRDVEKKPDRGRVLRAWGDPADGGVGGGVAVVPPAGASAAGGGQGRLVAGGGVEEGRVAQQVGGGGSTDSSEESRNSYYPYDQGQLENEARALSGHGAPNDDYAQPKTLRRHSSLRGQRAPPAYPSPAAPARPGAVEHARGGSSGGSSARESKRLSRQTASGSAGDVLERGRSQERRRAGLAAAAVRSPRRRRVDFSPSPPPSAPAGRLADRIRTLRERCCLGLGEGTFERAYRYLKAQEESDASAWGAEATVEEDREERLVRGLTDILGQNKVHYYSLIDQLIFIENTLTGPA